jgi:lipid II:glycine glycyltransferase (peptidoglycan interpeptide bridge formation enzyme)
MFHELAPSGNLVAFVGEASRHPVAMAVFTGCGEVLKLRLVGLDRSAEGRSLNVPGAVHWTAVRWARQHGYRWFDFGGVDDSSLPALLSGGPVDAEALSGPDRYKARFGGQVFRYPQPVELIPSAAVRHAYDLSRRSALGRRLAALARDRARSDDGSRADAAVGTAARPGRATR